MKKLNLKQYLVGGLIGAFVALAVSIPTTLLLTHQIPVGVVSGINDQSESGNATSDNSGNKQTINLQEAKEKALKHADISASQATFTQANLEHDDGRIEYEIDFIANDMEYDYTIDANTGIITEYDVDRLGS